MLKQVLLMADFSAESKRSMARTMIQCGLMPAFVKPDTISFGDQRDKSNVIILVLNNDIADDGVLLTYIRDIAIDEEKMIYPIGTTDHIGSMKEYLPNMVIGRSFLINSRLDEVFKQVKNDIMSRGDNSSKKGLLMIDDKMEYIRQLRLHLPNDFDIAVANPYMHEIHPFIISGVSVVLINAGMKMKFASALAFMNDIMRKKADKHLKIVMLIDSAETEDALKNLNLDVDLLIKTDEPHYIAAEKIKRL